MKRRDFYVYLPEALLQQLAKRPGTIGQKAQSELSKRNGQGPIQEAKSVFSTDLGVLYQGDCLSALDKIPDQSLDCIFADPPFNLDKRYGPGITDSLSEEDYLRWTRAWVEKSVEKIKPGGSFFIFNIPKWAFPTAAILQESLEFRHWIAIDLTLSLPIPNKLYPSHYALLYFTKGKPRKFEKPRRPIETCRKCAAELKDYGGQKSKLNPNGIGVKDIWDDISPVRHKANKNRRPNELHPKLLNRVIEMVTSPGDLIFDPFAGSGTTCAVAELKGRNWIACELADCTGIKARLRNPAKDQEILELLSEEKNCLFTQKDLKQRKKRGLSDEAYRTGSRSSDS